MAIKTVKTIKQQNPFVGSYWVRDWNPLWNVWRDRSYGRTIMGPIDDFGNLVEGTTAMLLQVHHMHKDIGY